MDLDDFEDADDAPQALPPTQSSSARLRYFDAAWFANANRSARWMDLLGDYAGTEPFVLDGESLMQAVLDDPLLAVARPEEPSFQTMHALHSLERILSEFKRRSAVFDIVFWHHTRHSTLLTGNDDFVVASRRLLRALLFAHLRKLDVELFAFDDLTDPEWVKYKRLRKPMFVMLNEGATPEDREDDVGAQRILVQRGFVYDLLSQGLAVTLLQASEFRDLKILSFVFDQRFDPNARARFDPSLWESIAQAGVSLVEEEKLEADPAQALPLNVTLPISSEAGLDANLKKVVQLIKSGDDLPRSRQLFLYLFLIHCLLLEELPLADRAQELQPVHADLTEELVDGFLPIAFLAIEHVVISTGCFIDVDGRVFVALVRYLTSASSKSIADAVGPTISARANAIWSSTGYSAVDVSGFAARFPAPPHEPRRTKAPARARLLPFSNAVFDSELESIHVDAAASGTPERAATIWDFGRGTVFSDTQHWHNHKRAILPKHLGGGGDTKPTDEKQRRRLLKKDQRFMANLDRHAQTLTGALGTPLKRIVIVSVGNKQATVKRITPAPHAAQPKKKAKEPVLSSADKIREGNKKKQQDKEDTSSQSWWTEQVRLMEPLSVKQRIARAELLSRSPRSKEGWLAIELQLYRLHLELRDWIESPTTESAGTRDQYTVSVMRIVKALYECRPLSPRILNHLANVLIALGFSDYIATFEEPFVPDSPAVDATDRRLGFEFVKVVKSKTKAPLYDYMRIREHPINWQLRVFGAFMDRSMDSQPDPRTSFEPDAWQRNVLDCLDRDESVLVVAPTSAGKTFISYYAMEKVLRESDDGILVYVAPTKALVSQIAAEVYARFSKDLRDRSCWAVHSRDYRVHDPQKCQILVTVPEILAIMLLSPPLARSWTPRIKRIILDEIHCIGQQEGGAVWEQILLLAPCPIIGLSATVGEPEVFNRWLGSVQEAHGFKHNFIHHPHRYSHLRKYTYNLQQNPRQEFAGLESYKSTERLRFLHPISTLSFGSRSMPPDLALEPADTLTLHKALVDCQISVPGADLAALSPPTYFEAPRLLRQKDILRYEDELKKIVESLMSTSHPEDQDSPLRRVIRQLEDPVLARVPEKLQNTVPDRARIRGNLIYMVSDLHTSGDLPAIMFSFDRSDCEIMAKDLVEDLVSAETEWREGSAEWKRKIHQWEEYEARAKQRERLAEREKGKKGKKNDDTPVDPSDTAAAPWEASFSPEDPSPQFSFANNTKYSKDDLQSDIEELMWRLGDKDRWLIGALRRGIAVHHAGMNKGYRSLVESLFRQGFLRVVIATGTLALGINAPARTSVFCGDSPFLTALMYRQCAGRAGRRGYDLLGKVVFYGLAMDRIQRLVLSKLPSLSGNFPLTSTMCLRLFNLLSGSDNAPVAVKAIQSMLKLPQISFGSVAGRDELLHLLRFSIDYLRRARLLDEGGLPLNLYGVAAHLYYTEPSNLALVALFQSGVIHRICAQPSTLKAKKDFITLMCQLFGRRYLPRAYTSEETIKPLVQKYPSMVVLPPMADHAQKALMQHEHEIRRVFSGYILTFAEQYSSQLGPDHQLPLSGDTFPQPADLPQLQPFGDYLRTSAIPVTARSAFVATSGHSDDFASVPELIKTARRGLHLNEHSIPSFEQLTHSVTDGRILNAYLLDFYIHGQSSTLAHANGVRAGDVWFLLQDFDLTLATVRGALEQLLLRASEATETADGSEEDSGYATASVDPAESDDIADSIADFKRPRGVNDEDWRVFEIVDGALKEFNEKFKAMWA